MSRPLSDDELRALDMRRIDDVLNAFASTPLDKLNDAQWLAELDSALIPGNMRCPLDVPDDPAPRAPKRPIHHAVGDADLDDADDLQLLPIWNDSDHTSEGGALREPAQDDDEALDHTDTEPEPEAGAHHTEDALESDPERENLAPSSDPGLNLSSGLRDLLARRLSSFAPARTGSVYGSATGDSHRDTGQTPWAVDRPVPAVPASQQDFPPKPVDDPVVMSNTAPESPTAARNEPPPIPLRAERGEIAGATRNALDSLRTKYGDLSPNERAKLLVAGVVLVVILVIVSSCLPDKDSTAPTASETTSQAAPATGSSEIPVPDSAVGVLAPSTISARCPDGSTEARLAFTSDKSQAWICKRALGIDGAVLEMTFPHPVVVTDVFLVPGFDYVEPSGIDRWVEHRAVTRAQWTVGGQRFIQQINPSRAGANMAIPSVETQKITLTIMETSETPGGNAERGFGAATGKKVDSFAISLIRITGHQP